MTAQIFSQSDDISGMLLIPCWLHGLRGANTDKAVVLGCIISEVPLVIVN